MLGFNSQILDTAIAEDYKTHPLIFFPQAKFLSDWNLWQVRVLRCTWFDSSKNLLTASIIHIVISDLTFLTCLFQHLSSINQDIRPDRSTLDSFSWWSFPFSCPQCSTFKWRAHAVYSCLCPGIWGCEWVTGQAFWRWKVTGSGVRRRALPIFVCTRSVHRG